MIAQVACRIGSTMDVMFTCWECNAILYGVVMMGAAAAEGMHSSRRGGDQPPRAGRAGPGGTMLMLDARAIAKRQGAKQSGD